MYDNIEAQGKIDIVTRHNKPLYLWCWDCKIFHVVYRVTDLKTGKPMYTALQLPGWPTGFIELPISGIENKWPGDKYEMYNKDNVVDFTRGEETLH